MSASNTEYTMRFETADDGNSRVVIYDIITETKKRPRIKDIMEMKDFFDLVDLAYEHYPRAILIDPQGAPMESDTLSKYEMAELSIPQRP